MKHKQFLTGSIVSAAMLAIILDGQTALEGAREGLSLCIQTIIPSLFPFLVLSILQTDVLSGSPLQLLRPLGRLYGIPEGTESILISGYLGGYPVGAQCISNAYHSTILQRDDAERMLAFCNNAGPAFLFGMVGFSFADLRFVWLLWGIHVLSSFLVAVSLPTKAKTSAKDHSNSKKSFSDVMQQALKAIAMICGWVILFRILVSFLRLWILWCIPIEFQTALIGFLELTNGCCELATIPSPSFRFVICSCILAFGGICVFMQTHSVTQGLSLHLYVTGKLLHTFYSFLISVGIAYQISYFTLPFLFLIIFFLRKAQKRVAFKRLLVYNGIKYTMEDSPCCFGRR